MFSREKKRSANGVCRRVEITFHRRIENPECFFVSLASPAENVYLAQVKCEYDAGVVGVNVGVNFHSHWCVSVMKNDIPTRRLRG